MAHIAFFAPNGHGHVNLLLGPAAELVRRGHRVTFAAPESLVDPITGTDAEHVPTPTTWKGQGESPQMHGAELIRAMGSLLEEIKVVHADQVDREAPDLVVHDATLAWWGRPLAHRWGVPVVGNWPDLVSNKHWSPHHDHTRFNPLNPRFPLTVFRMIRYERSQGYTDGGAFMTGADAALRLVTLSKAFQQDWTPPTDDPILLVSSGTAYNERPDLYREIVRAARGRSWHVVMSIGGTDLAALGDLPPNVEVHARVPHSPSCGTPPSSPPTPELAAPWRIWPTRCPWSRCPRWPSNEPTPTGSNSSASVAPWTPTRSTARPCGRWSRRSHTTRTSENACGGCGERSTRRVAPRPPPTPSKGFWGAGTTAT